MPTVTTVDHQINLQLSVLKPRSSLAGVAD
ncbi:hypothetical protein BH18VER1_BH18VER1_13940 [soil metagenome]